MSLRTATKAFLGELRSSPSQGMGLAAFLSWAMGGEPTASGEVITPFTALQQLTVYSCVRIISESVSSLPCKVYQRAGKSRNELLDSPIAHLVGVSPNEEMSAVTFWDSLCGALALTGNCYAEIQRDKAGRPVAIWPLNPTLTTPQRDRNGILYYETSDGMSANSKSPEGMSGSVRIIKSEDMFHVPLFCFDGLKGLSPIGLARQGIGLARAAELFGARFFGNGAKPGGILSPTSPDIGEEEMEASRKTWLETQSGSKQGSIAVLPGDWKYTPLSISPEDSQFIQVRGFQRTELAALFRVPPSMVGDVSKQSKASAEQEALAFVTDTLRPYLARIESEILRKLLPAKASMFAEFDVSERLRADFKTSMDGFAVARQWGFYNANMVLEDMGKNPIGPIGDVFWVPVNMQNAERLLDTESIQDQPVGAPSPVERKMLGKYTSAYLAIFRDAFGRLVHRDKRDASTVQTLLGPVLRSITESAITETAKSYELDSVDALKIDDYVEVACRSILKRSGTFTEQNTDQTAQAEFVRALRSIHINVNRDIAAAVAEAQLQDTEAA